MIPIISYGFLPTLAKHLWNVPKFIVNGDYISSQNKTVCFDYKDKDLVTANASFITTNNSNKSLMVLYCNNNNIKFNASEYCSYFKTDKIHINYGLSINTDKKQYVVNHKLVFSNIPCFCFFVYRHSRSTLTAPPIQRIFLSAKLSTV